VVATQQGMSAMEATLTSIIVYSGAAQFMLVGLLAAGTPMALTVGLCLLLNARHALYRPGDRGLSTGKPLASVRSGFRAHRRGVRRGPWAITGQPAAQRPLWLAG